MRAPSRILSALFGATLIVAVAGVAGAEPSGTDVEPTATTTTSAPALPTTTVGDDVSDPEVTSPVTTPPVTTPSDPTTPTTPPPDVGIEMGTVAIRAATLSDDQPIAGVSVAVARCETGEIVGTPATGPDGTASVSVSLGCYVVSLAGFPDGYDPASAVRGRSISRPPARSRTWDSSLLVGRRPVRARSRSGPVTSMPGILSPV